MRISLFLLITSSLVLFGCNSSAKKAKSGSTSSDSTNNNTTAGGGGGGTSGGSTGGGGGGGSYGVIFVSTTHLNGTGGSSTDPTPATTGIPAFDAACASNATAKGLTGTFKALMVDSSTRVACTTSSCVTGGVSEHVDWPLATRVEYRREDKTSVVTKSGKYGVLTFNMTNAISATAQTIWTGIGSGWNSAGQNCSNWTTSNPVSIGRAGLAGNTNSAAINGGGNPSCDTELPFLCVQVKSDVAATPQASYRKIFATSSTYSTVAFMIDGVARLDGFCSTEARALGYTDDDTFKAFVTANDGASYTSRIPCYSYLCATDGSAENSNWVLGQSREYRRQDGTTVIGFTNTNGIFDYPLSNSVTGVNEQYWSGVPTGWAIFTSGSNANDCGRWTSNDPSYPVFYGVGNATDVTSFTNSGFCDTNRKLLCVEQTR